jgi:hypothetical protein
MVIRYPARYLIEPVITFLGVILLIQNLHAQETSFETFDFRKADSIAALYPDHSITDLKKLSIQLTAALSTEPEKFRAIFRWVCNNIENDYEFYVANKKKREKLRENPDELAKWNRSIAPRVFQKLHKEHKTVCTGYAYLVKELANQAGLTCEIIDGYGRTAQANVGGPGIVNHTWNAVELNNKWFLCDATWSSGSIDELQRKFVKQFDEVYFLTNPSLFALNHYPLDTSWSLLEKKANLEEYLNAPIIYKDALRYNILPLSPSSFNVSASKGKPFVFRFTEGSETALEELELQIIQGEEGNSVYRKISRNEHGPYVENAFTRRGAYVVHILGNGKYLFTYTVKISK